MCIYTHTLDEYSGDVGLVDGMCINGGMSCFTLNYQDKKMECYVPFNSQKAKSKDLRKGII